MKGTGKEPCLSYGLSLPAGGVKPNITRSLAWSTPHGRFSF
jgi:hypothetical protein